MTRKLRIAILWTSLTNYAHSCFEELAKRVDVDLWVGTIGKPLYSNLDLPRKPDGTRQSVHLFDEIQAGFEGPAITRAVEAHAPDIYIGAGWNPKLPRQVGKHLKSRGVPTVCCADTPWLGTVRQTARALAGGPLVRGCYDAIMIPGARGLPVARLMGFSDSRIWFNMDCGNSALFSKGTGERLAAARSDCKWAKKFLFVGRLVKEKNIRGLLNAYEDYRQNTDDPWPLTLVGDGPERRWTTHRAGVESLGWLDSNAIADQMAVSGVFVLPSHYEAWGVVVHEAASAGLPLMLSMDVGAGDDLLRDGFNGRFVDSKNRSQIANTLKWFSKHESLWELGERSFHLSRQFSPSLWATNVIQRSRELLASPRTMVS